MHRRAFLRAGLAGLSLGLAGCAGPAGDSASTPTPTRPPRDGVTDEETTTTGPDRGTPTATPSSTRTPEPGIGLETIATGFRAPLGFAVPPGRDDRRYVVDQPGRIFVHGPDGLRDEPFLDIAEGIEVGGEKGLLGIALHPAFDGNRRFYVRYSAPPRSGTPSNYSHTFVLAEFRATEDGLGTIPGSERTVLEIPEPQPNHNAGAIAFGPDGHLYVAVGDGGAANDQGRGHADDWYDAVRGGNGQDVTRNLLGSVLRIDVDGRDGDAPYAVPDDNPLVGREGLDEHYAWGLRNPWRMSFDGDTLIAGDVGQNRWEEVDVVERGGNYGWNVREGSHCFLADDCPDETPAGEPLIDPVVEYPHGGAAISGISVIGGYVYRGSSVPALEGLYVFGDLQAGGRLFVADPSGGSWPARVLEMADDDGDTIDRLLSFGRDDAGELYVLGTDRDGRGVVARIVAAG